jgi:hypothetical protein
VFAKSDAALESYRSLPGVRDMDNNGLRAWTDDHSDILGAFWSRYRGRS